MNAVAEGYCTKGARDFFRDMLLRNAKHYRNVLDEQKIRDQFNQFDAVYSGKGQNNDEFKFLMEQPPKKLEISKSVIQMCREAKHNIRIIQPYVQPIDELEDALIEALEKRNVRVEIVSARIRD